MMVLGSGFNAVMKGYINYVLDVVSLVIHMINALITWRIWNRCYLSRGNEFKSFTRYNIDLMLYNPNSQMSFVPIIIEGGDGLLKFVLDKWAKHKTKYSLTPPNSKHSDPSTPSTPHSQHANSYSASNPSKFIGLKIY